MRRWFKRLYKILMFFAVDQDHEDLKRYIEGAKKKKIMKICVWTTRKWESWSCCYHQCISLFQSSFKLKAQIHC